jgi:hypothetical protein
MPDRLSRLMVRKSGLRSGSLEDSCPSDARARPTKLNAQKGGLSRVAWRTPCPSDTRVRLTKLEAPLGPCDHLIIVVHR